MGTWGDIGIEFIQDIGKLITDQTGDKRSTSFLFQSISMAVQRGNTTSILGTMRTGECHLEEIYYL